MPRVRYRDHGLRVLGRGLLRGAVSKDGVSAAADLRTRMPRFRPENLERNLSPAESLRSIGRAKRASPAQSAIAWVLARGDDVVPLMGTTRRDRLNEAVAVLDIALTDDDIATIEWAVPTDGAAGERYDERQMAMLDSERGAGRA